MGRKLNLVRPDGGVVTVTEEQAAKLLPLGYRVEEVGERMAVAAEEAERDYYSTTEQQLLTGLEGAVSGLTGGLIDPLLADDATSKRAQYNPGIRTATEIGGAVLPTFVTGGTSTLGKIAGTALRYTPAGQLARGGAAISKAIGGVKGAAIGAGIEGAVAGAGAEITRTALSGDDLTVEGVLASAGLGGAFGAGAGILSHGFERVGTRSADKIAEADRLTAELTSKARVTKEEASRLVREQYLPDDAFNGLRGAVDDYIGGADNIAKAADSAMAEMDRLAKFEDEWRAARFADDAAAGPIETASSARRPRPLDDEHLDDMMRGIRFDEDMRAGELVDVAPRQRGGGTTLEELTRPSAKVAWKQLSNAGDDVFTATMTTDVPRKAFRGEQARVQRAFAKAEKAVRAGDEQVAFEAMAEYREAVEALQAKIGGSVELPSYPVRQRTPAPGPTEHFGKQFEASDFDPALRLGEPDAAPAPRQAPPSPTEPTAQPVGRDPFEQAAKEGLDASVKAARDAIDYKVIRDAAAKFPRSSEEFLKMSRGKAEQMFAALDKALKTGGPEMDGLKAAMADAIDRLAGRTGVVAEGSPVDRLRTVYSAWRSDGVQAQVSQLRAEAQDAKKALRGKDEPPAGPLGLIGRMLRQGVSRQASTSARRIGAGAFLSSAAYQGAGFLAGSALTGDPSGGVAGVLAASALGSRARALAGIHQAVAKWAPRAGRVVRKAGPRIEPLAWSASGVEDEPSGARRELFKRRSEELAELGAVGKDRAYALASQFQADGHDEFAVALHQKMTAALEVALGHLPRDPGKTPWGFESLWEPTPVQLEVYSRVHRAVFSPMATFEALAEGDVHPVEVEAVQTAYPGLYTEWKAAMLERLMADDTVKSLSRQDLSELSVALDMQMTPTQRPEWIAAQQQMFSERNAQKSPNPSGPVGRPAGAGGMEATAAQQLTER